MSVIVPDVPETEALTVGARCLVLVVGGLPKDRDGRIRSKDLAGARAMVRDGIGELLEYARPATAARCVLIGNAAQTLHPVAGQGFNLGVRDAFVLAQAIIEGGRDALGDRAMVAGYASRRRVDRYAGIAFTHGLTQLFAPDKHCLI